MVDAIRINKELGKYQDLMGMFTSQIQSMQGSVRMRKETWGCRQVSSKCPRMKKFMNVGSNRWLSRFSEILNIVMEKIHSKIVVI